MNVQLHYFRAIDNLEICEMYSDRSEVLVTSFGQHELCFYADPKPDLLSQWLLEAKFQL